MPIKHNDAKRTTAQFEGNPTYKGKQKKKRTDPFKHHLYMYFNA